MARCRQYYQQHGKGKPRAELSAELTQLKQTELWLYDFDSQMLQQALADLWRVDINFFERRAKVPEFKKKKAAEYQAQWNSKHFVQVDRFFPSVPHAAIRTTTFRSPSGSGCRGCRTHYLRDCNPAKNVRAEGLRIVAEGHPETENACGLRVSLAQASVAG